VPSSSDCGDYDDDEDEDADEDDDGLGDWLTLPHWLPWFAGWLPQFFPRSQFGKG